jgi:hypothetical protein
MSRDMSRTKVLTTRDGLESSISKSRSQNPFQSEEKLSFSTEEVGVRCDRKRYCEERLGMNARIRGVVEESC